MNEIITKKPVEDLIKKWAWILEPQEQNSSAKAMLIESQERVLLDDELKDK